MSLNNHHYASLAWAGSALVTAGGAFALHMASARPSQIFAAAAATLLPACLSYLNLRAGNEQQAAETQEKDKTAIQPPASSHPAP